ncbi:MAG TPA: hypothetical protein VFB10_09130 [Candidatus Dormibacteraeota bacterium]|nr:hypothetical protein [Candidatus Dormibacteraeota bacterium]
MKDFRQSGPADTKAGGPAEAKKKRPYVKPSFEYERVFETMALACGKLSPTQAQCRFNRKNS